MAHRPEFFASYYKYLGVDLVLSGHTHGGQARLPFLGGLYAPNQGRLPKYDAGVFQTNNCTMIINTGLWHGLISFRLNNPPEVVLIDLVY